MINLIPAKAARENGAISIAFALGVIILLFVVAVTSLSYIGTDTRGASNYLIKSKAFYASEGCIEWAVAKLKGDPDWRTGDSNVTIGDAVFSVTVVDSSTIPALNDTIKLTCAGTEDDITKTIETYVLASGGYSWPYGIYANIDVNFGSGSGTITGDVHANNSANMGGHTVIGAVTTSPNVDPPTVDWNFFENEAIGLSQKVTGDKTFNSAGSPYSGVWYITGSAFLEKNTVINGTVISENDCKILNNNVTITPSPNYPALVISNTLTVEKNNADITGFVYCGNDIDIQKNNFTIVGALVANATVKGGGNNKSITYNSSYISNLSGINFPESGGGSVTVGGWREN